jgi:hypothetical protein
MVLGSGEVVGHARPGPDVRSTGVEAEKVVFLECG